MFPFPFIFMSGLQLFAVIAGAVAAGILIAKAIKLLLSKLVALVKERLAKRNVSKVATGELAIMAQNCTNQSSLSELEAIMNGGATHIMFDLDENNRVIDNSIALYKDEAHDMQTSKYIDRTGEGLVIINN